MLLNSNLDVALAGQGMDKEDGHYYLPGFFLQQIAKLVRAKVQR